MRRPGRKPKLRCDACLGAPKACATCAARAKAREKQRARYAARKASGVCARCAAQLEAGTLCEECREEARVARKAERAA